MNTEELIGSNKRGSVPKHRLVQLLKIAIGVIITLTVLLVILVCFLIFGNQENLNEADNDESLDLAIAVISQFFNKSKSSASASANLAVHFGEGNATISKPFKDAIQACWYYHANYKHSHPYTVLWNKPDARNLYPKIRVIAEPAYWSAENCSMEKKEIKLIGTEYTKHTIEAQFGKGDNFIPIATSHAFYKSALYFDDVGRVTERKIIKSDFEYKSSDLCDYITLAAEKNNYIQCEKKKASDSDKWIDGLKNRINSFNILQIDSISGQIKINMENTPDPFREAIILYIKERKKLHDELAKEGCGVISIEPKSRNKQNQLIKTSLAFLCHKEKGGSHVRLMQRISEDMHSYFHSFLIESSPTAAINNPNTANPATIGNAPK